MLPCVMRIFQHHLLLFLFGKGATQTTVILNIILLCCSVRTYLLTMLVYKEMPLCVIF